MKVETGPKASPPALLPASPGFLTVGIKQGRPGPGPWYTTTFHMQTGHYLARPAGKPLKA